MRRGKRIMDILEISIEELTSGALWSAFSCGARAVVVRGQAEVRRLWSELLENGEELLPWEAPMLDIARNHLGGSDIASTLGDVYYFQPGEHGYIARKIQISRNGDGLLSACPSSFVQAGESYSPEPRTLELCCTLTDRIMAALQPPGGPQPAHRTVVQRLKYQDSHADFDKLAALSGNALGRWGRLGFAVDRKRQEAKGPLRHKGWSDLIGMILLVPWLAWLARIANGISARFDRHGVRRPGDRVVEHAHCDERYFTALCGLRDTIRTEALIDGVWHELPISLDALTILPGRKAQGPFGITPTLHRVVQMQAPQDDPRGHLRTSNVTLLLGAV